MSGLVPRYIRWRRSLGRDRDWNDALQVKERQRYQSLKEDLTRAPDGSYPTEMQEESSPSSSTSHIRKQPPKAPPLEVNNPLSLSEKNPWHGYFASLSMLDQIKVDIERAFPDDPRLRPGLVQRQLARNLFVWSLMEGNEDVGYRQGMHEIAAICWLVRSEAKGASLEETWIEADTFILFEMIMDRARGWYEWRNQPKFAISRSCDAIQALLASTDARLADHFDSLGVEVQLFAVRWIRLIFTRELPLTMALGLWDGLFSLDPSLQLVDSICVAMLIRIRKQLLASDYSSTIQTLLNYPLYAQQSSPLTLLKQAQEIKQSPSELTLMQIVQENEETLEIPEIPQEVGVSPQTLASPNHPFAPPPSIQQLTKGVYAQTLSAGFNRALYNVQRTVNAAYLSHSASNGGDDGFPPAFDSIHRSNYPPKDAQGELEEVRKSNKAIGNTLVRVIDVLEKHWSEEVLGREKDEGEEGQATQMEIDFLLSLTTLKHSRDVLLGVTSDFDPSIMDGPKMIKEDKDHKARDFGQRFKRTIESEVSTNGRGAMTSNLPAPAAQKPAATASLTPPSQLTSVNTSPLPSIPPALQHQPLPPRQTLRVKETIDDPLGAGSR